VIRGENVILLGEMVRIVLVLLYSCISFRVAAFCRVVPSDTSAK